MGKFDVILDWNTRKVRTKRSKGNFRKEKEYDK